MPQRPGQYTHAREAAGWDLTGARIHRWVGAVLATGSVPVISELSPREAEGGTRDVTATRALVTVTRSSKGNQNTVVILVTGALP